MYILTNIPLPRGAGICLLGKKIKMVKRKRGQI
jgi:hypothetical protein